MGNWTWKTDILEPVSWLNLFNHRSFEAFAVKPLHQILLFIEFWHMRGISSRNITKHWQHCRQRTWIWGLLHWENIVPDIPMERTNSLSIHILKQTNWKSILNNTRFQLWASREYCMSIHAVAGITNHGEKTIHRKKTGRESRSVWKSWRGLEKTPKAKKLRVLSSSGLYLDKFDAFTGLKATLNGEITCEHISAHAEAAAAMAHDRSPNICDFCGMHQCFQNKAYVNDILPYISLITVSSMSATFHLQTSSNKIFYQPDTRVTSSSLRTSATPSRSVYDLMQRCRSLKWRLWWSQFSYAHLDKRCVKPESFIRNGFLLKFRKWHPPATSSSIKDSPARLGQFLTLSSETDWRSADIPLSKKRSPLELLDFLWILLDLVILKYNRLNKWLDELTVHLHPDRCKQYSTWKLRIHG